MTETCGDYSLMTQRRAGQAWSGGQPATQWAWSPQADGTSQISWGVPSVWPPPNFEVFRADSVAGWAWMLGYGSTDGQWLPQVVTAEWIGDASAANWTPLTVDPDGWQHYAHWAIPAAGYSLYAEGHMDWMGTLIHWRHRQVWSPPAAVSNASFAGQRCIRQSEVWWDDQATGGAMVVKQQRDHWVARGLGPAFIIRDQLHGGWRADGRYFWAW